MDHEFLSRLNKAMTEFTSSKFSALLATRDAGQMRELQGAINAIGSFKEMIADANNPQKKQENEIAEDQYNV